MAKAHSYLRESGTGRVESDGFTRHLKAIREYAAAHDAKIALAFKKEGVNGTLETMHQAAWGKLVTVLDPNGACVITVDKLDRLTRDLIVHEAAIEELRKDAFELISVAEANFEGEIAVLDRIKELRASGIGFRKIAAAPNAEGLPSRTGKSWQGVVGTRMLTAKEVR